MAADWISVGGEALFAPLNVLELVESRWGGHNQQVTEANVRSIDMANGGTDRRTARRDARRFSGRSRSMKPAGRRCSPIATVQIVRLLGSVGSCAGSSDAERSRHKRIAIDLFEHTA